MAGSSIINFSYLTGNIFAPRCLHQDGWTGCASPVAIKLIAALVLPIIIVAAVGLGLGLGQYPTGFVRQASEILCPGNPSPLVSLHKEWRTNKHIIQTVDLYLTIAFCL